MVCENNEWYVTKYPNGWTYDATSGPFAKGGSSEEADGIKSVVIAFVWQVVVLQIFEKTNNFQRSSNPNMNCYCTLNNIINENVFKCC